MEVKTILNAALILLVGHLILGVILWLRVRKLYSYPNVFGWPVIGNLFYFYRTLLMFDFEAQRKFIANVVEKFSKNGICFGFGYGYKTVALISNPEIVKQLGFHPNLKDKPGYTFESAKYYLNGPFRCPRTDDVWKMKRKDYNSLLRKSRVDSQYYKVFTKYANKMVECMLGSPSACNIDSTIIGVTQCITLEGLFGVDSSYGSDPDIIFLSHLLRDCVGYYLGNPGLGSILLPLIRRFDETIFPVLGRLRRMVLKDTIEKINDSDNADYKYLTMYITSRNPNIDTKNVPATAELQEVFITASHTISATLINGFTFLAVLPEIQERAWKEQYEIFGDDTREPTLEDLQQMKYLERFMKECLRFSSPTFIGKEASGDVEIDGIVIPKGAYVLYLMEIMRNDPKYWKNPERFDPDRFLEETEMQNYSFKPFGVGIRSCPGMTYAYALMKIVYSKVLRKTKFSPAKKGLKFEDLKFEALLLLEQRKPPLIQVEKRV